MWKEVELEHPASCTGFDLLKQKQSGKTSSGSAARKTELRIQQKKKNGERSSKHWCAQCLACRGEQLPVGQRALPVATHASDTQPAVYFLYNRKWTGFWREGRGRAARSADPEPNTISVCLETGFGAILTPCWQKILAFRVSTACLYSMQHVTWCSVSETSVKIPPPALIKSLFLVVGPFHISIK